MAFSTVIIWLHRWARSPPGAGRACGRQFGAMFIGVRGRLELASARPSASRRAKLSLRGVSDKLEGCRGFPNNRPRAGRTIFEEKSMRAISIKEKPSTIGPRAASLGHFRRKSRDDYPRWHVQQTTDSIPTSAKARPPTCSSTQGDPV